MSARRARRLRPLAWLIGIAYACAGHAAHAQDAPPQATSGAETDDAANVGTAIPGNAAAVAAPGDALHAGAASPPGAAAQTGHVAPPPPSQPLPPMSADRMDRVMDMHDDPLLALLLVDQFERAWGDRADATAWDAQGWIGHDFDKLWLRSEGESGHGAIDARVEAFWDHAFASFWDWQLGVRRDLGTGPQRDWAAFGVQGLAPYWFELEATAYLGAGGRTALRLRADYDLLLTQRLILQPELELDAYGRRDPARSVAAGLDDVQLGLRLRYEFRREFAPYIGVVRQQRLGNRDGFTAGAASDTQLVAGVRVWF